MREAPLPRAARQWSATPCIAENGARLGARGVYAAAADCRAAWTRVTPERAGGGTAKLVNKTIPKLLWVLVDATGIY